MHPELGRIAPDEVSNRVQDRKRVKLERINMIENI